MLVLVDIFFFFYGINLFLSDHTSVTDKDYFFDVVLLPNFLCLLYKDGAVSGVAIKNIYGNGNPFFISEKSIIYL